MLNDQLSRLYLAAYQARQARNLYARGSAPFVAADLLVASSFAAISIAKSA